jgi:hypothetical protein
MTTTRVELGSAEVWDEEPEAYERPEDDDSDDYDPDWDCPCCRWEDDDYGESDDLPVAELPDELGEQD